MSTKQQIRIKTNEELKVLRRAGSVLAAVVDELQGSLKSGMTTKDIDVLAERLILSHNVKPAFKGYRGFPATACVSVNNEIVHGIPGNKVISDGDIVSIDIGLIFQGYYSDMAVTLGVGAVAPDKQRLLAVTKTGLQKGIEQAIVGNRLSDISHAIQAYVEEKGLSVVRDFVGHGIGKLLHEEPEIPNFGPPHCGPELKEGMVFAIEPMVNIGSWQTKILDDGWTVVTADGNASAHFEHSIAITSSGPEILTQ